MLKIKKLRLSLVLLCLFSLISNKSCFAQDNNNLDNNNNNPDDQINGQGDLADLFANQMVIGIQNELDIFAMPRPILVHPDEINAAHVNWLVIADLIDLALGGDEPAADQNLNWWQGLRNRIINLRNDFDNIRAQFDIPVIAGWPGFVAVNLGVDQVDDAIATLEETLITLGGEDGQGPVDLEALGNDVQLGEVDVLLDEIMAQLPVPGAGIQ